MGTIWKLLTPLIWGLPEWPHTVNSTIRDFLAVPYACAGHPCLLCVGGAEVKLPPARSWSTLRDQQMVRKVRTMPATHEIRIANPYHLGNEPRWDANGMVYSKLRLRSPRLRRGRAQLEAGV
jgi:hypothetical protein